MDISLAWLSELEMEGYTGELYDRVDNFGLYSISPESTFQTETSLEKQSKIGLLSEIYATPKPLVSSFDTLTLSFRDLKSKDKILHDSFVYEGDGVRNAPTKAQRNLNHVRDRVLVERKRRVRLNQYFISLSALIPNLRKMDKASILEDATKYIKELQDCVKELEGLSGIMKKDVEEIEPAGSYDEYSSSHEINSGESSEGRCKSSPDIVVRISGDNVLVRLHCQKDSSSLVEALTQIQKLGLLIISNSSMTFTDTTLVITVVAQIEHGFAMTTTDLVRNLQRASYMNL